jgi:hypothetical protein
MHRISLVLALVTAAIALTALVAPGAGASSTDLGDDWQALQVTITGDGTVTGTGGYSCPDAYGEPNHCSRAYAYGSLVNLVAEPAPGWLFGGWQGCDTSAGPICQVLLDVPDGGNTSVSAQFVKFQPAPTQHPLTVAVAGNGRVQGSGIDCPGDCSGSFIAGSAVTLQATAGALSTFVGWSGACSGGPQAACVVQMDGPRAVVATFAADIPVGQPRTLTVEVTGPGSGSVDAAPAIACPGDCTQTYSVSTAVTLAASPAPGSVFAGWSGDCAGSAPSCQLELASSRTAIARFERTPAGPGAPPAPGPGTPPAPAPQPPSGPKDPCTITGTAKSDVLVGTPGRDVICGLGGNDRVLGKGGDDILVGGAGADTLDGGPGHDFLYGDAGRDRLTGGTGRDRLAAGSGNDRVVGGRGTDRLLGGKGIDVLLARDRARDRLDGGPGRDRGLLDRVDVSRRVELRD